jgi:hypothetical protein
MKTQIIALETHDDLISVRDRLSWAKSPRVLLVWPKYEQVTLRAVDLRVLQQHAAGLGAQLGLVTRRADVRRDAEALQIPVFESTTAAQREAWPARRASARIARRRPRLADLREMRGQSLVREAIWLGHPAARVGFFAAGVLAVLAILTLFVPSATVKLKPASQVQSVIIPIAASPQTKSVFITGSVPARSTSILVDGTQRLTVTSQGAIPETRARGVVRFKNLTSAEILIPAGTVVYSRGAEPVRFATLTDTRLPPGVNAIVETLIEAVQGGAAGNLEADMIQGVEGGLGLSLAVTNPASTEGGTEQSAIEASAADHERVRNLLLPSLEALARARIGASVGDNDLILYNTLQPARILAEDYDPPAGQPGTTLTLTMQMEFTAQYVSGDDLSRLAGAALAPSIAPGFVPLAGSLRFEAISTPVGDESGVTHFELKAERVLVRQIEAMRVAALTRGLQRGAVESILQANLPLEAPAELDLRPAWWPWMPLIPFRIQVITP